MRAIAAALALAGASVLSGCSSYALIDSMPAAIGAFLTDARAAVQPAFRRPRYAADPADTPLTDAEKKCPEDLAARRAARASATNLTPPSPAARRPLALPVTRDGLRRRTE